jgi:predicted transcriptional regulator
LRYSNISPQSFSSYYLDLLEKELIAEEYDVNDTKYVKLTNRGIQYIRDYKVVLRFVKEFEL